MNLQRLPLPVLPRRLYPLADIGVRERLTLLVILIMVPLLALQVLGIYTNLERRADEELQASRELAQAATAAFVNYLENLWDAEAAIGTAISSGLPAQSLDGYLATQLKVHATIVALSWVDARGVIVGSTNPAHRGRSMLNHTNIQRVLAGETDVISNLIDSHDNRGYALFVTKAIREDGRLKGAVVATVEPRALSRVLPVERIGASNLGLADRRGLMVFRSNDPRIPTQEVRVGASSPAWIALREGRAVVNRNYVSTIDGTHRMGVFMPVTRIGWVIAVTSPIDEVLAGARLGALRDALILLVLVTLSLFAVALLADSFIAPVNALKEAAQSISNGNLTARVGLTGSNELAMTGQAFDRMAERIQQLESERSRFLQVAAHELRNPMATAKGAASLLRLTLSKGQAVDDNVLEDLRIMEKEVDRLSMLLNDILDAFRLSEGQLALNLRPVDLSEVVASAIRPFTALDRNHRFRLVHADSTLVLGDYRRLEDVFRNLISNAVKYSPPGSEVRISVKADAEAVLVAIKDHGFGIPEDEVPRVFESFYRASNLKGRDPEGMGLGLNICENIVKRHGGRIWVESQEEQGSTFFVEIPRLEQQSQP